MASGKHDKFSQLIEIDGFNASASNIRVQALQSDDIDIFILVSDDQLFLSLSNYNSNLIPNNNLKPYDQGCKDFSELQHYCNLTVYPHQNFPSKVPIIRNYTSPDSLLHSYVLSSNNGLIGLIKEGASQVDIFMTESNKWPQFSSCLSNGANCNTYILSNVFSGTSLSYDFKDICIQSSFNKDTSCEDGIEGETFIHVYSE